MDKATEAKGPEAGEDKGGRSTRRRGSQLDKLTIGATVVVRAKAPPGSRQKGYEDVVVQDLSLTPAVTRYRRERWETPDGKMILAELDCGIVGGYGPNLHRLVLGLHFSGTPSPFPTNRRPRRDRLERDRPPDLTPGRRRAPRSSLGRSASSAEGAVSFLRPRGEPAD